MSELNVKYVVLCLGHLYKTFVAIKILASVQGGGARECQNPHFDISSISHNLYFIQIDLIQFARL